MFMRFKYLYRIIRNSNVLLNYNIKVKLKFRNI